MEVYLLADEQPATSQWQPLPGHPGLRWSVSHQADLAQDRLELAVVDAAVVDVELLAWLGLSTACAEGLIRMDFDDRETHPGWLLFYRERLLVSLPAEMDPRVRLERALGWGGFFLMPVGQTRAGLRGRLEINGWRLDNYQTLMEGLQLQMQAIRRLARSTRGARAADRATVRLLGLIHRLEHDMHAHLERTCQARSRWAEALQSRRNRFIRQWPHHLLQGRLAVDHLLPEVLVDSMDAQARQAADIRDALQQKKQALQAVLRLERDEEMSQISRQQHWFSLILAALAVMTAVPLITGELDGDGVVQALERLPEQLAWMGAVAERLRPGFVALALGGSLMLMLSTGLFLVRRLFSRTKRHRQLVAATGEAVACLRAVGSGVSDATCARSIRRALRLAGRQDELTRFLCEAELGCRRPFPLPALESARAIRQQTSRPGQWLKQPEWHWIGQHMDRDEA